MVLRATIFVLESFAESLYIRSNFTLKSLCQACIEALMSEPAHSLVADRLQKLAATWTRGWPRVAGVLPCTAVSGPSAPLFSPVLARVAHTPISPCTASSFAISAAQPRHRA